VRTCYVGVALATAEPLVVLAAREGDVPQEDCWVFVFKIDSDFSELRVGAKCSGVGCVVGVDFYCDVCASKEQEHLL